ncbi:MAG: response regulator transcription factor [Clostridia bacterium]|nr:response regulator transcription factor [Clostridia bacterium]
MKLLLAEDETALNEAITDILVYHKYLVDSVYDGADALDYARLGDYDGIILDIMMPEKDGLEVLSTLRREGIKTPVLLLTAKSEIEDRIAGLDAGADDYLPKPFAMGELLARIRAMLRRREDFTPDVLTFGDLTLNCGTYELGANGQTQVLPKIEFRMMEIFMLNKGIFVSGDDLLAKVWGYNSEAEIGTVWVYISYLRKRLSALGSKVEISAKRNVGYTLTEANDD